VTRRHVRAHTQVLEALVGVSSRPGPLVSLTGVPPTNGTTQMSVL